MTVSIGLLRSLSLKSRKDTELRFFALNAGNKWVRIAIEIR
jgi:hypothetical protein